MTTLAVILTTLTGLVGLEWILRNALALRVWRRVFHVTDASPRFAAEVDEAPRLSVIVPAKDEAEHIGPCLQRLREQDYPNLEFIVVDDRSRDRTVEIVEALAEEDPRLRLLRIEELPPGWSGKVHALHRGIESARGEWFCMTDADCRLIHPAALSVAMEHARRSEADLLSLFPTMRMGGFWEYFLQPICIGVLMIWFRPEKVNRANKPHAFANGQFLLLRREAYEAIGTYQAMRDSLGADCRSRLRGG